MSGKHTTGARVLAARLAKGMSRRRAARRLSVSPRMLRNWERGREDIPLAVRTAMVTLYGIPREQLIPDRPTTAVRDEATGTITIGSVTFAAAEGDDDSMRAFLSAVRTQRGVAADAPVAIRSSDASLLADFLGGTPVEIIANLQRLLGVDEQEAVELGQWMFRRTALAGALAVGLMSGVVGTGALSAHIPAAAAAEAGPSAERPRPTADNDYAVIGDAAVLERSSIYDDPSAPVDNDHRILDDPAGVDLGGVAG